jgi:TonB family protein
MKLVEQSLLRRNFTVACVLHVALIGGVVLTDQFWNGPSHAKATMVDLVVPADILGDLPEGPGHGRGAWSPPAKLPPSELPGPNEAAFTPEEKPAPKAPPAPEPGEIAVPKKVVKETKPVKKPVVAATKTAKPVATTAKNTGTATKSGPSASDIRAKFSKALAAGGGSAGGTPYGDNKPVGGGDGKKRYGRPGSPDGAENGVVGGMGKGTPYWWYYQHVHDRMYEAWERPAEAANWDKKLMSTVMLRVARDGKILEVKLQDPSGNKLMDETAVAAAKKVPRLDPLPDGMKGDTVDISVNFSLEG